MKPAAPVTKIFFIYQPRLALILLLPTDVKSLIRFGRFRPANILNYHNLMLVLLTKSNPQEVLLLVAPLNLSIHVLLNIPVMLQITVLKYCFKIIAQITFIFRANNTAMVPVAIAKIT